MEERDAPNGLPQSFGTPPTKPGPLADAPASLAPRVDLANTDVLCRNCGFNLRGLQADGRCPECGMPVANSIAGDHLIYSPSEYLAKLSTGLLWVILATILQFVASIGVSALIVFITLAQSRGVAPLGITTLQWQTLPTLVNVPLSLALLYGWWMFSEPDPGVASHTRGQTPRRIVRWASVIYVGVSSISATVLVSVRGGPVLAIIFGVLSVASPIAALFQFFASLMYVKWLAQRMHHKSLVETASRNSWMLPIIYIFGMCVCGLGPMVALIFYLVMLNDVRTNINAIRAHRARTMLREAPA